MFTNSTLVTQGFKRAYLEYLVGQMAGTKLTPKAIVTRAVAISEELEKYVVAKRLTKFKAHAEFDKLVKAAVGSQMERLENFKRNELYDKNGKPVPNFEELAEVQKKLEDTVYTKKLAIRARLAKKYKLDPFEIEPLGE